MLNYFINKQSLSVVEYPSIPGCIGDVQDDVDDLYDTSEWVNGD